MQWMTGGGDGVSQLSWACVHLLYQSRPRRVRVSCYGSSRSKKSATHLAGTEGTAPCIRVRRRSSTLPRFVNGITPISYPARPPRP